MLSYLFYLIVYPLLLVLSVFTGRIIARRSLSRKHQWRALGVENGLMGFYALLTSFTLVQSAHYAGERDLMIHTIADDMSEVLRISSTDGPELHARIRLHFSDLYKIIKDPFEPTDQGITARIKKIDRMDDVLDGDMRRYIAENPGSRDRISALLAKTDRLESQYYRLMHSYNKMVPGMILFVLVLFSMFIGFLVGFLEKFYDNHIHIISIIFVVISVILLNIIHDLNNPSIGLLKPDFRDISEVIRSFKLPV